MSAIYEEFERELARLREQNAKTPRRELTRLFLMALEREEIVTVAYREQSICARLATMPISDDVRELIRHALVWAWKDEEMHAIYIRGAIFRSGGFLFSIGSVRVSLSSTHRTLLALLIVIIIRTIVAPRVGPFGRWTAQWQRLLDSTEREPIVVSVAPGVWRRAALAGLGIAAALGVLLHDQLRHLDWVPDLGDPLFSTWRIGWIAHQIVTSPLHLFDANIFYPERLTLTLSDPVISSIRKTSSDNCRSHANQGSLMTSCRRTPADGM